MANPKYLLNRTGAEVNNILSSAESHVVDDSKHITSEEKTKLAGIESGANKTTVDAALDTESKNPVQNKVITDWLAKNVKNYRIAKNNDDNVYLTSDEVSTTAAGPSSGIGGGYEAVYGVLVGSSEYKFGSFWGNIKEKPDTFTPSVHTHDYIPTSQKGVASGVAELDATGKVLSSQLPSYVDDVIEGYLSNDKFYTTKSGDTYSGEISGESGKIYVDLETNKTYRWSSSTFVLISDTIALGETPYTAYRGDRGKTAYDHASAKGAAFSSGLYKITTNDQGHVTAATAVEKSDITALGVPAQDTVYTHPSSHPATMITEDSTHRFVTDAEKAAWNESNTFIATYGTTTTAEIEAAYQAGKTILLDISGSNSIFGYFVGRNSDGTVHLFYSVTDSDDFIACICNNNNWTATLHQGLPTVSTVSSGKILMVNDSGKWAATEPPQTGAKVQILTWEETD